MDYHIIDWLVIGFIFALPIVIGYLTRNVGDGRDYQPNDSDIDIFL